MNEIKDMIGAEIKTRQEPCEKHGVFTSRQFLGSIWSRCPTCENERRELEAQEATRKAREAQEQAWQARIGHSGIPDRFRDRTLDTYVAESAKQQNVLDFARHYAENFAEVRKTGKSALLIGKPGTGKTHLAAGIALHVMPEHSVLFTTVLRAARRVKDTWNKASAETETQAIAALVYPALLILDEVGVQYGSDAEKLILFDVLNERYERRKPTILLSNLTLDEVRDYLGERIFDRMREDGGKCFVFDWSSHRGKK